MNIQEVTKLHRETVTHNLNAAGMGYSPFQKAET
jgi:hypothetical protein